MHRCTTFQSLRLTMEREKSARNWASLLMGKTFRCSDYLQKNWPVGCWTKHFNMLYLTVIYLELDLYLHIFPSVKYQILVFIEMKIPCPWVFYRVPQPRPPLEIFS